MNIFLAEVEDTVSISRSGTFLARIVGQTNPVIVSYVSPFGANGIGGFVSIPTRGQEILVCNAENDPTNWYYLGSTFSPPRAESSDPKGEVLADKAQPLNHLEPAMYRATGRPMRYVWQSPLGHKILMSDEYSPDFFNTKIEMRSSLGKSVRLVDSPKVDSVIIENEHNDGMRITGRTSALPNAPRSIELTSMGPQRLTSLQSQIDIVVNDGRELNIVNRSSGANKNPLEPNKYGNVNIESTYKDINLRAVGPTGKIFIQCLAPDGEAQLIEIETKGQGSTIRLYSKGDIQVHADKSIFINSKEDINLASLANINLGALGQVNIKGGGGINLDGVPLYLNSNKAAGFPAGIAIPQANDNYDDLRIY